MKRIVFRENIFIDETHLCICDKTYLTNQYVKYITKLFSRNSENCDEFCVWNDILKVVIYFADATMNRDMF